ncbi:dUTP diphosphatase [Sulfoacidibacillus thermotolerans]|uniref:dUTP diphosphatase n=1 Tax=Sulfoacidibacillus thermotolerans TaxID=1765684 RepID=A0A2U3DAB5_SULT2|nr:dUTP diphosphatase [Sulfoacidibacillus thermotolerans]PWI58228.1 hypothetical protein BM613_04675 [Sulfoacidibacillus thermotolerans]
MRRFEWVPSIDSTGLQLPKRQTAHAAGYDLFTISDVILSPRQVVLVPTGVRVRLQPDECLLVYARSSLALKYQLMLANGVGVIDADYYANAANAGHIFVPLVNIGEQEVELHRGERIAQGVFTKFLLVDEDSSSDRESEARIGGFGSTDARSSFSPR